VGDITIKSQDICKRVGKPSEADARVLSKLFPSSSACERKRPLSTAFDPTKECVALPQQKKKKAARVKPSNVQVVIMHDTDVCVPKQKRLIIIMFPCAIVMYYPLWQIHVGLV